LRRKRLVALALGAAVAVAACGRAGGTPTTQPRPAVLKVRVAPVEVRDVVHQIRSLGSLEPRDLVQVTAQVEGAITEVRFREGDRATPQTVLLRIDPDRYRLEAERAEAVLHQAKAELTRAGADLKRREALAENELVAVEELTRSRSENAQLTAAVEVANAAHGIALQNLARAEVRPPIAGVIDTRRVDTGQWVKTGDVLATIVDAGRLRLRFKVSEAESLRAREGGEVVFRVAPLGAREFAARIYHVGRLADPATRQVEVLAWVDDVGELKPGFFAEVMLAGERKENALVVPEGAVQASEQGFVTYVVEEGRARLRPIQIGLRTGTGAVEILSGLKPRETVVIEGSDRLADGVAVEPVGEAAATADGIPPTGQDRGAEAP